MMDSWSENDSPSPAHLRGIDNPDLFVAKLTFPTVLVGNDRSIERHVNNITFLFKRKGAMYCDRIQLQHTTNWDMVVKKYNEVLYRWNEIIRWVQDGEIDPDDDIVIYRTGGRTSNRILNRYPIRMKDNTYAIITGQTEYLAYVYNECQRDEFDGRPVPSFDEWIGESVYRGRQDATRLGGARRIRFFYNGAQFINRCRLLYYYFASYAYNIRDMLVDTLDFPFSRMNFLLWKDGKIRVWESANADNDMLKDSDHFPMLTYDDGHVSDRLINSDYGWSNDDNQFTVRWRRSNQ